MPDNPLYIYHEIKLSLDQSISMLHLVSFIQLQFHKTVNSPNFDSNLNQPVNIRKLIICFR